jgi:alkyl sulfatase BDS1-like metallo-beta-lactamase superfamily hydrolase
MSEEKDATKFTEQANKALYDDPNFHWRDKQDFEFAERGFIAAESGLVIKNDRGDVVWSNIEYEEFQQGDAPPTVNPSLWRVALLNNKRGLFKVTDGIYQVRGQSLSNICFIEGKTGYIIIDPNITMENARHNLELVYKHVGKKPVVAVVYSHSHADHWGGVKGVTTEQDVASGRTKVIASKGFLEYAISENLIAGNAMSRRAEYMYGPLLSKGPKGQVDSALGKTTEVGSVTLIVPTDIIEEEGNTMTVDGVEMVFQFASGEAPTGMHVYLPQHKTLHVADNCYHSLQNVYTIRGAYTRDAIDWRNSIHRALKFKDAEFLMGGHNWPIFGKDQICEYLRKQRDALKYLHDQSVRLLNHGYTDVEIANMIELPPSLASEWYLRGYYGSIKHCVRGIYSRYMGWYDANPTHLDPMPPRDTGKMMVEYMGGADAVIERAQRAFDEGKYRWVAQVMDYVVWAEPDNERARKLTAAALEQLGYQTENATWRNAYLMAAVELRYGIQAAGVSTASPDVVKATPIEDFFDYLGVQLNGPEAFGKHIIINWNFTDTGKKYVMALENSVLNYEDGETDDADLVLTLPRSALNKVALGEAELPQLLESGEVEVIGDLAKLGELFGLFDKFPQSFQIATHDLR